MDFFVTSSRQCNLFAEMPDSLCEASPAFLRLTHLVHGYEILYMSRILHLADPTAGKTWAEKLLKLVFQVRIHDHTILVYLIE